MRGGNDYPSLIRKIEPKPLRIFLQDGSNDANAGVGDWWMANQEMERALTFAGYEVNHDWGDGGHNGKHATAIFPDAIRWLWKGWPAPVKAGGGLAAASGDPHSRAKIGRWSAKAITGRRDPRRMPRAKSFSMTFPRAKPLK